ncbi:MAG TPA: cytochrome P450 [Anaerolineales bacterium]|nr:cytochrome P450 [Anaerolineales bacterium]
MPTSQMPGPVIPAISRLLTALSPVRLPFDSLKFITDNTEKYGELFALYFDDQVNYVVSDPQIAHDILVTRHAEFHKAPLLRNAIGNLVGNGLLTSEGEFWKRQRKLAQPAFHYHRIASYSETMVSYTQRQIATWHSGEIRDIAEEMMALTLAIVNKTLFNMEIGNQAKRIGESVYVVLEAANDRLNSYAPIWERWFKTRQRREAQALAVLFEIIDDIIATHGEEDTGDLLSMLLSARDDEGKPMSAQQLRDEVVTLFTAGHETTANALDWIFYLLAQNPTAEEKLLAEVDALAGRTPTMADLAELPYSERVVKEAMRLYPPASGAMRSPLHDIELGGYPIPQGSNVAISTYAMHRNPKYFPNPLQFDPERFSPEREPTIPKYSYLPFGGGPRICIGNSFAMMEARLVLVTILQHYRLTLLPGQKVQAEQLFTTRPKGGLKMKILAREKAVPNAV